MRISGQALSSTSIGVWSAFPALLVSMVLAQTALAADRGNLIRNGNFENVDPANPTALPRTFSTSSDGQDAEVVSFSLDPQEKTSGERSLRIHRETDQGNARVTIARVAVRPGGRYYLSCQVKSTEGRPGLLLGLQDRTRQRVEPELRDAVALAPGVEMTDQAHLIMLPRATSVDPDGFNELAAAFTVPPDAHLLTIQTNYSWVVGTAWFDDFQLFSLD